MQTDVRPTLARRIPRASRRRWIPTSVQAVAITVILGVGLVSAASLHLAHGTALPAAGEQNTAVFLVHWQQMGSAAAHTPTPVPGVLSGAVGTPSRLPGASASRLVNPGVSGHVAVTWILEETIGVTLNAEVELSVQVHYLLGAMALVVSPTTYVETQTAAIGGMLTFMIYVESGQANGITLQSQFELSQACVAVGTCP